jgi:hypothetical protein
MPSAAALESIAIVALRRIAAFDSRLALAFAAPRMLERAVASPLVLLPLLALLPLAIPAAPPPLTLPLHKEAEDELKPYPCCIFFCI